MVTDLSGLLAHRGVAAIAALLLWLAAWGPLSAETVVQGTLASGEWTEAGSPYHATADLVLPAGSTLTVQAGVVATFDPGVSFEVFGQLSVLGAQEKSARFVRAVPGTPWGGVAFRGSDSVGILEHLELTGPRTVKGETRIAFKVDDGAKVTLRSCWFHDFPEVAIDATGGSELVVQDSLLENSMEAIHTAHSYTLIEGTTVRDVHGYSDSIDLDYETTPRSVIRNCIIEDNSEDDGIDLQGSSALIENVILRGIAGGKAISIDLVCTPIIRNVLVYDSMWGFVVKDSSTPKFERCTVTQCEKGFYVFEKTPGAGGGHMTADSMIVWNNVKNIDVDARSTLALTYSLVGGGYAGEGNIDADPLFVDPAAADFHLLPGSPAIGTGKGGGDMGAYGAGGSPLGTVVEGTLDGGEWTKEGSPYHATGDLLLPAGKTLTVQGGVLVMFDPGVSFEVYGRLLVPGTQEEPVRFIRAEDASAWGGVAFRGTGSAGTLEHLELSGSSSVTGETGIAFKVDGGAKVTLRSCWLHDFSGAVFDATAGSELVIQDSLVENSLAAIQADGSYVLVEGTTIRGVQGASDSIHLEGESTPQSVIRNCIIEDNEGDDGIDVEGASILVEDVILRGIATGNAVSVDGVCTPVFRSVLVYDSLWGFVVKDGSTPRFERCTVTRCERGFYLYEKTFGAGGGHATAESTIVWDNATSAVVDARSTLALTYSLVEGGYAGEGNIDGDPLFADPAADDFRLLLASPAIGSGKGGVDMGALPPVSSEPAFTRGDANRDGSTDVSDAIFIVLYLFVGTVDSTCLDALDADDLGAVDITDAVYLLSFLFLSGSAPPAPYPGAGLDPTTGDPLGCAAQDG